MWRWDCGGTVFLRAMPSRSEGRRTFMGLTVHDRLECKLESRLQSSPAGGLTVTKAEADHRGEAEAVPSSRGVFGGSGAALVVWCIPSTAVRRGEGYEVISLSFLKLLRSVNARK